MVDLRETHLDRARIAMTVVDKQDSCRCFQRITTQYGELLTLDEVAIVFRYRTTSAVRKAHARGTLPVRLYRFEHRSGYYAKAEEVAESIARMKSS